MASSAQVVADIAVEPSKGPHALYISKAEREQVCEAIRQPPVEFREIIQLREYEELSYQEIAVVRSKLRVVLSDTSQTRDRREKESCE